MAEHTRRRFLGRGGSLALAYALAGCGIEGTVEQAQKAATPIPEITHKKVPIGDWTFSNWPLYIDKKILKDFDKKYGGHVKYVEDINDNDEFYGKVRQQLAAEQPIGRDIVQLQSDNPDLKFIYPDEGAMLFTDNMMIPAKAEHMYAAETMMNYVYEPEVAATLAIYVNYLSPVKGIQQIVEKTEPDIANNPLIFPSDEIRAKLHPYPALSDTDERTMKEAMAKVTGA